MGKNSSIKIGQLSREMINSIMSQSKSNSNQIFLATLCSLWLQRKGFSPVRGYTPNNSSNITVLSRCLGQRPITILELPSFKFCTLFHAKEFIPPSISPTEMLGLNLVPESKTVLALCRAHSSEQKSAPNL